jgi:hypothetical protein
MKAFIALLLVAAAAAQTTLDLEKELMTTMLTTPGHFRGPFSSHLYGKLPLTDRMYADTFKHHLYTPEFLNKWVMNKNMIDLDIGTDVVPGRILSLHEMIKTPLFMEYYNIPLFRQFWTVPSFKVFLTTPTFQLYWTNPMFKVLFENPTYFYKYIYPMVFNTNVHRESLWTRPSVFNMKNLDMVDMVDVPEYRHKITPLFNLWNTLPVWGRNTVDRETSVYDRFLLEKLLKTIKISKPEVTEVKTDVKVEKPEVIRVDEQTVGKMVNPITHQVKYTPIGDVKTIEEEVAKKVIVPEVETTVDLEEERVNLPHLFRKMIINKPTFGGRWIHPKMIPALMRMKNEIPHIMTTLDEMRMNPEITQDLDLETLYTLFNKNHRYGKLEEIEEMDKIRRMLKNIDYEIPRMTTVEKLEMMDKIRQGLYKVPLTYNPVHIPRDIINKAILEREMI